MPSPLLPAGSGTGPLTVVLYVLAAAVPVLLGTAPLLRRLPEPAEPDGKPCYRDLATPRLVATCTLLAGLGAALVALALPRSTWPLWWVLCGPALVLAAVDARTTWLPLVLTRATWVAAVGAALTCTVLGGPALLGRTAVGAAVAGLLYLLLWRLSGRAIGFGDVRFAPLLGAASASAGWSTLFATLLLGSVAGALVGLGLTLRGRRGAFPYAPSMLAGAFLACGLRLINP